MEEVPENLRRGPYVGFADMYRKKCKKESKPNNEIDNELYAELVKLDTRLGKRASDQLYECLSHTTRSDIIKVRCLLN